MVTSAGPCCIDPETAAQRDRLGLEHAERLWRAERRVITRLHCGRRVRRGFSGARSNLEGKLSSLTDSTYVRSFVDEIGRLSEDFTTAARTADALMMVPPARSLHEKTVGTPSVRIAVTSVAALRPQTALPSGGRGSPFCR